jgi:hypothetical protein
MHTGYWWESLEEGTDDPDIGGRIILIWFL